MTVSTSNSLQNLVRDISGWAKEDEIRNMNEADYHDLIYLLEKIEETIQHVDFYDYCSPYSRDDLMRDIDVVSNLLQDNRYGGYDERTIQGITQLLMDIHYDIQEYVEKCIRNSNFELWDEYYYNFDGQEYSMSIAEYGEDNICIPYDEFNHVMSGIFRIFRRSKGSFPSSAYMTKQLVTRIDGEKYVVDVWDILDFGRVIDIVNKL